MTRKNQPVEPKLDEITGDPLLTEENTSPTGEKVSDEELLARIQAEFASRPPAPPRRITIAEMYQQAAALICSAMGYKTTRLKSETTAVRIYELTLMWALNNRGTEPSHDILDPEEIGDASEGADEALTPEPNETIEASADQADTQE